MDKILLYDTTLRDGTQGENITFSAEEKVKIAQRLDEFGVDYIEGGWPGSNPKDMRFFELAKTVQWQHARLTAFGATRRKGISPDQDANIRALLEAETPTVAIFVFRRSGEHALSSLLPAPAACSASHSRNTSTG